MAATGFIIPAKVDLEAIIGGDWETTVQLFTDEAQTTPFSLSGYTVTFVIGDLFTLASGSGLTITAGTGTIVARLTNVQTGGVAPETQHYHLKLVDGSSVVSFPLNGNFKFVEP